jgi:transcriptional regulator of acetoin/glycerol metabolism
LLPPLRERADFADIVAHLLGSISPQTRIDDAAVAHLRAHNWPGNIRELRNLLTRLTLTDELGYIDATTIDACLATPTDSRAAITLKDQTAEQIVTVHRDLGGNLSATARRLGVSRNTIYRALARRKSTIP